MFQACGYTLVAEQCIWGLVGTPAASFELLFPGPPQCLQFERELQQWHWPES